MGLPSRTWIILQLIQSELFAGHLTKGESTLWGGCFLPSSLPMVNGCGGGDHPALKR